jgi:hypothetical protein
MKRSWRVATIVVLCVLGIAAMRDFARMGDALPWRVMYDFGDFYCAGDAIAHGENPYTYEPLHSCEHRINSGSFFTSNPAVAVPAPQPPYVFPPFVWASRLDVATARTIDAWAIVVALLLTALALTRLGIPFDVSVAVLALPVGYIELNAGQVVPFALLFLALCGASLRRGRDAAAGVFAALTAIEPHLGLSIALAALLFVPRARIALIVTALLMAVVGVATTGAPAFMQDLLRVIPAQAVAEIGFPYQYSLTYVAHFAGVPPATALLLGNVSFLAVLAGSLWYAPRIATVMQRRELLAFFPAACATLAGSYVHMVELCFAIPAALVFVTASTGGLRKISAVALCGLMVPWIAVWGIKKLLLVSVFFCLLVLVRLGFEPIFSVAVALGIALVAYVFELAPPMLPPLNVARSYLSNDLVQTEWRDVVTQLQTTSAAWFAVKLPTWAALTALVSVALFRLRAQPGEHPDHTAPAAESSA